VGLPASSQVTGIELEDVAMAAKSPEIKAGERRQERGIRRFLKWFLWVMVVAFLLNWFVQMAIRAH
jgi:magnesium-transporting ATPase (P-type)